MSAFLSALETYLVSKAWVRGSELHVAGGKGDRGEMEMEIEIEMVL
jgi:hypothetical protein